MGCGSSCRVAFPRSRRWSGWTAGPTTERPSGLGFDGVFGCCPDPGGPKQRSFPCVDHECCRPVTFEQHEPVENPRRAAGPTDLLRRPGLYVGRWQGHSNQLRAPGTPRATRQPEVHAKRFSGTARRLPCPPMPARGSAACTHSPFFVVARVRPSEIGDDVGPWAVAFVERQSCCRNRRSLGAGRPTRPMILFARPKLRAGPGQEGKRQAPRPPKAPSARPEPARIRKLFEELGAG